MTKFKCSREDLWKFKDKIEQVGWGGDIKCYVTVGLYGVIECYTERAASYLRFADHQRIERLS